MRVLLVVSSSRLAGTERHVIELAAGLRHAGVDAQVACEPGGQGLDRALEERGVPVHPMALTGAGLVRAIPRLAGLARNFDLLHTHLTDATAAAVGARALTGRPVVETRHFLELAHETRPWPRRVFGRLRRRFLDRRIDLVLVPSTAVAEAVGSRALLVPHGVDVRPTEPLGGAPSHHFVTVGRLEPDRDHAVVLQALAAGLPDLPARTRLTVVGDGSHRQALQRLAGQLGIGGRVTFTGWLDDPGEALDRAGVYLTAANEAFGLAPLEAMSRGLPVVATNRGGTVDLVADGRTGILVEPEPTAMAAAMISLAADPQRAAELGEAGRGVARDEFSVERMTSRTIDAYRRLVEPGRPKVMRVYHSAVVAPWRERDRELRRRGAAVTLVTARSWNEGGRQVSFSAEGDSFVVPAHTFGAHPNLFAYDPRPLWRTMRRQRFDVIDVHEEPCSVAATQVRLLRRLFQPHSRLVLYSAQNIPKRYPWPFRSFESAALREAGGVYPCNRAAGVILRAKGFTGDVHVLPLGVDVERFAPRTTDGPAGDALRIGYVGRLEDHKGVDVLLRAVAGRTDWTLDIVGTGPAARDLVRLAGELGLEDVVRFRGSVEHDRLPDVYRAMDVLAVPSLPTRRWLEQFCRVAVEAMASGLPVVASASGALPEVVGDAGLLVEPGDHIALRDVLQSLVDDPDLRRELGMRGRVRARTFTWTSVAEGHLDLYRAVSA